MDGYLFNSDLYKALKDYTDEEKKELEEAKTFARIYVKRYSLEEHDTNEKNIKS